MIRCSDLGVPDPWTANQCFLYWILIAAFLAGPDRCSAAGFTAE